MLRSSAVRLIAASALATAMPVRARAAQTVRVGGIPVDDMTAALYAQSAGIFARHGLDVQFQGGNSGSAIASGVAGGSLDIGKSSLIALILAHVHGLGFQLVAPAGLYDSRIPVDGMIALKDATIKSGRDLNGKPISSSSLEDMNTVATRRWVDVTGGDSRTLQFIELPNGSVPAALEQGRVVAATFVGPIVAQSLASGRFKLVADAYGAVAKRFLISAWFSAPAFLNANPDAVKAFALSVHEAAVYTNTHTAETTELLATASKVDPKIVAGMPRSGSALTLDPALIQPVIDVCAHYNLIPASFPAREMLWNGGPQR